MLVRDVMATDLVTVPVEATLAAAVERMLDAGVGSVIVVRDGAPTGILTETDSMAAGLLADLPFSEIPVEGVMSSPLVTVQPDRTLRGAVERMGEEDLKKLPVVEDMDLVGIVTMTDVVAHYGDVVREAHAIDDQRDGWEGHRLREVDISDLTRR